MTSKKLSELVVIKGGKRLPKGSQLQIAPNSHPYIRVRDMGEMHIPSTGLQYVPDNVFPKIQRYIVNTNDVLISIVGSIGLVSVIDEKLNNASQTENTAKLSGLDKVDAYYLYYYLLSSVGQQQIKELTIGAVQPKLPLYNIAELNIEWKTRLEREHIVNVLLLLDSKISNNTSMNATLEKIAQRIFKSWFVDFDPVKANAEGIACGKLSDEIQALFPNELEESELGMIPKGWGVNCFSKLCTPKKGKNITRKTIVDGDIPVIAGGLKPSCYHNKSNVLGPSLTCSASGANAGYVALHQEDIWASDCSYISLKETSYVYFSYLLLKNRQTEIFGLQQGCAQPHVYPNDLSRLRLCVPNESILDKLESIVKPIFLRINENQKQSNTLSKIRDKLLPRLISGKITIQKVEELLKEAS